MLLLPPLRTIEIFNTGGRLIDKGLDRSWGFGQNFEVEKLRISGTDLRGPNIAVILETSRLDIGQKMAGLAWFRMGTEFLGKKILSSRPIYGTSSVYKQYTYSIFNLAKVTFGLDKVRYKGFK